MRKVLIALLVCLWSLPAWAVPARVQGNNASTGFAASLPVTLSAVGSGNALVVGVVTTGGAPVMTDNGAGGSATYTPLTPSAPQGGFTLYMFVAPNVTHAPTIITATPPGSGQIFLLVDEVSGIATSSPLDGNTVNLQPTAPTGANGVTSGSITTATNGDFIWSVTVLPSTGTSIAAGTGFTAGTGIGGFSQIASESQVQGTAGAITATFTIGASTATLTGVMGLKPPGGASSNGGIQPVFVFGLGP